METEVARFETKGISMKYIQAITISVLLLGLVSCKTTPNFGPLQCLALANLADSVWVRLTEVYDEDKAALVSVYSDIGKDLAAFGCAFVPDPLIED